MVVMQGYGAIECGRPAHPHLEDGPRPGHESVGLIHAGPGQAGRRRRDTGQRAERLRRLLARPGGHRGCAFTAGGWYRTGDIGPPRPGGHLILMGRTRDDHRRAQRAQRIPRGLSRTCSGRRASATRSRRRDPAGADRGGRPRARPRRSSHAAADVPGQGVEGLHRDPADFGAEIDAAVKRANATLAVEPASGRLATLARRRLPADPHPQGQARPGPGLGRRRAAATGQRRGRAGRFTAALSRPG